MPPTCGICRYNRISGRSITYYLSLYIGRGERPEQLHTPPRRNPNPLVFTPALFLQLVHLRSLMRAVRSQNRTEIELTMRIKIKQTLLKKRTKGCIDSLCHSYNPHPRVEPLASCNRRGSNLTVSVRGRVLTVRPHSPCVFFIPGAICAPRLLQAPRFDLARSSLMSLHEHYECSGPLSHPPPICQS
jgi:hypothetical protein